MRWRQQPPVLSRVSARGLLSGIGAHAGFEREASPRAESILRARYGARDVLLTDSGKSALRFALTHLLPASGTVAYPGYGCADLTTAAVGAGARVRLYDLDPKTLSPDLDSVRAVIRRGVEAIVVTHLYGYPADVAAVKEIAATAGIPVIEDAAQGAGGKLYGKLLGSFGDITVLSFARGKGTTCGNGGALLAISANAESCVKAARSKIGEPSRDGLTVLSLLAQRVASHPLLYRIPASIPALRLGEMIYHHPHSPRALSAVCAAILRHALEHEQSDVSDRQRRARRLLQTVGRVPGAVPVRAIASGESGYLRLALLDLSGTIGPHRELGIIRGYPMTLDQHAELRECLHAGERAGVGSRCLRDNLLTIPTHSHFSPRDLGDFADSLTGGLPENAQLAVTS
ncbi:MAG TPA: DegT/DnrJ/EryC1/StrS family aminotransferase [Gemmatimonadaceae bacterium]|nr:DegT/DnrJ/EryC1/StrS family aminotransferase [Gemmatimonadaceae bacterium]